MLSDADTRAIQRCRDVLNDLAAAMGYYSRNAESVGEAYTFGHMHALIQGADTALLEVTTYIDRYLDDVHAAAKGDV